ncbi:MAG: 2-succinyl-5-enolpyruvyl-6-hydroxy-3-cyclohexene-1-carboxylic-acid synthase [Bacteroidetes bacterium]|nr:2-succinyl-5-enolpyruvyl-6-hydroxy-3-cyclohexene-1-carboxylic-acid synthase [Bacteroidota bacterium]
MNKTKVNKNFIWAKAFVNQLCTLGVRFACISPGSRSTPLTLAFAEQKKIKCFVHIDERVSGFFAIGLAKASGLPVAIVTTSGTATAELYPAIIESYQQRIPLIICTADRPPELLNTGANQTINQWNLYRNHIRWFKYLGLPQLSVKRIINLQKIAVRAFETSIIRDKGPVHLNFPFRKPLEPDSFTDEVGDEILMVIKNCITPVANINGNGNLSKRETKRINKIAENIIGKEKGLIIVGPKEYDPKFISNIKQLSKVTGYPVLADGVSHLRFRNLKSDEFICTNYDAFLRSNNFITENKPEIVLQFGRTFTSAILEKYLEQSKPLRFIINDYGDLFDPSKTSKVLKFNPISFCENLIRVLIENKFKRSHNWLKNFKKVELLTKEIKTLLLKKSNLEIEPKVFSELISILPSNTKIMVGNSLPIHDFDNFVGKTNKNLKLFFNRGASGIDGVTTTALGITSIEKPTILITGDLSFIHDLNALLPAKKYSIPLVVILINNNGGGIFEMLPVSSNNKFKTYFKTPHNLNIAPIVKSFGLEHHLIKNEKELKIKLINSLQKKSFAVLEILTDSISSKQMRKKYWAEVIKNIERDFSFK